jgi:hypothetical protein
MPLCAAVVVPVALLTGVAVGTAGGVLYGLDGLSDMDALYVNEALSHLDEQHDFQLDLVAAIRKEVHPDVQAAPGVADVLVVTKLDRIEFFQRSAGVIRIKATGSMTFDRRVTKEEMAFQVESDEGDIDRWLADDGRELAAAIERCIVDLSAEMSSTLTRLATVPISEQPR